MPQIDTLERFIARVEANAHIEAIREFYTESTCVRPAFLKPIAGS